MIDFNKQIVFVYGYGDDIVTLYQHETGRELAGIDDVKGSDKNERENGFNSLGEFIYIVTKDGMYEFINGDYIRI
ncbi:hypothetical protein [Oceanobacillus sp. FSL H7-0719]|uniref:hypothetical protein n=1 Tax=Oceanobacillus sp. FSL H7-0719 TaxID=2954507 RepID=UPI003250514B